MTSPKAGSEKPKGVIRFRYLFAILCMAGMTVNSLLRVNYTMSASMHLRTVSRTNTDVRDGIKYSILAYFGGNALIALPAGRLAELYSAKWMISISTLLFAISHLMIPLILKSKTELLITVKFVDGLIGGVAGPAMLVLMARWSPPSERFVMCGITYAGNYLGGAVGYFIINYLSGDVDNWFRLVMVSGIAFVYLIFHMIYVNDYPHLRKRLAIEEKQYIESSLGDQLYDPAVKRKCRVPWKGIFTSTPFLALFTVHAAIQMVNQVSINRMVFGIRHLEWKEDVNSFTKSVLISSPWFWCALVAITMGMLFSTLHNQDAVTKKTAVKIVTTIGLLMPLICLPIDYFLGEDWELAAKPLMFITMAGISNMVEASHIELAPNFAGTLLGMTSGLGHLVGGIIHANNERCRERTNLAILYSVTAVVSLTGVIIYNIFVACEIQTWNDLQKLKRRRRRSSLYSLFSTMS